MVMMVFAAMGAFEHVAIGLIQVRICLTIIHLLLYIHILVLSLWYMIKDDLASPLRSTSEVLI